jgi:hypothetical protein
VFALVTTVLVVMVTSLADHLAGWALRRSGMPPEHGWIFPPHTRTRIETCEFEHTIETNRLGLRDREFELPRVAGSLRIAVVGDSFSYGWGVPLEQTWVQRLERHLRAEGPPRPVEVVNLGKPGGDPLDAAAIAERVLSELRPDLLVVAITQGDDLLQLGLRPSDDRLWRWRSVCKDIARGLYPTMAMLVQRVGGPDRQLIGSALRRQAQELLDLLTPEERTRYLALDAEVRAEFEVGRINPAMIKRGVRSPSHFHEARNPSSPLMILASRRLDQALQRIQAVCRPLGIELIVVTIPYGSYVSPEVLDGQRRLGFEVDPSLLRLETPEEIVETLCRKRGITHLCPVADMRVGGAAGAFYPLDGHFTSRGNAWLAAWLTPRLQPVQQASRPARSEYRDGTTSSPASEQQAPAAAAHDEPIRDRPLPSSAFRSPVEPGAGSATPGSRKTGVGPRASC